MSEKIFTKTLIKYEIEAAMKKADASHGDFDFLTALGAIRNRAVYLVGVVTGDEFDELCEEILNVSDE